MPDPGNGSTNLTPVPSDQTGLPLAQGGAISSAAASASQAASNTFDPTSITQTTPSGQTTSYVKSADSAVSTAAPTTDNAQTVNIQVANRSADMILNNVLNNYIDATYHITFGMVSYGALQQLQKTNGVQNAQLDPGEYIIFCSTGDNQTNSTKDFQIGNPASTNTNDLNYTGDYYNIQSLSFRSFVGHLPQNPIISAIVDGKLKLYETYGFQFREDIDDLSSQLGYPSTLSPVDYVYRMEIWFSGYDPKTGAWTSQIPIPCPQPGKDNNTINTIVYYVVVSAAEAKVTPSGTFYELSLQQFAHYATRAENIVLHHENLPKTMVGSVNINASVGSTFGGLLASLAQRLHDQVYYDTQYKLDITYEFTGLEALFQSTFTDPVNIDFSTGVNFNSGSGAYAVSANAVDIFTLLNNVMINVKLVRELLLQSEDPQFTQPTVWWNIRTNILQAQPGADTPDINSNQKYTFEYVFEPVLSYRSRMPIQIKDWNQQVESANQQTRVNKILDYSMLYRWYDYYFTGDNSEIIDFQFMFKYFYYMQIPYPGQEVDMRGQGAMTDNRKKPDQTIQQIAAPNIVFQSASQSSTTLQSLLAIASPPQSATTQNSNANPANQHQHRHRGPITWAMGDYGSNQGSALALAARDQYMRWDMINAQMTVRFDPQWILNPYMSGSDSTPTVPTSNTTDGVFVYAHTDRMIYLNAFAPNQAAFMNPNVSTFNIRQTPILGGFYQVIYIENEFKGALFTQKLNMIKYDHLNYYNYNNGSNSSITQNQSGTGTSPPANPVNGGTSGQKSPTPSGLPVNG